MACALQLCFLVQLSLVLQPICARSPPSKCQWLLTALSTQTFTDITVQPESINTTLNSTVNFTCEASAVDDLDFRVNDTQVNHKNFTGFTASTNAVDDLRTGTLQAMAYDYNNNTNITCRATSSNKSMTVYSKRALLLIQGLSVCMVNFYFDQLVLSYLSSS